MEGVLQFCAQPKKKLEPRPRAISASRLSESITVHKTFIESTHVNNATVVITIINIALIVNESPTVVLTHFIPKRLWRNMVNA